MDLRKLFLSAAVLLVAGLLAAPLLWGGGKEAGRAGSPCCGLTRAGKHASQPQATCPVSGGPIDKAFYADVEGHRVYTCGPGCVEKVKADPAKYLAVLETRGEEPKRFSKQARAQAGKAAECPACGVAKGTAAPGGTCPLAKAAKAVSAPARANVGTGALAVLIRARVPMVILDARGESVKKHLPGATPVAHDLARKEAGRLVPGKETLVVTYCGGPTCPLSAKLARRLRGYGYENILEYPEGISGWTGAGHPVATTVAAAE